ARLSPINRRVFIVHASFIVYVLIAFGVLLATRADLFIQKSDLARIVLAGMTLFFALRALAQPLVFDPVLAVGWRWSSVLEAVAGPATLLIALGECSLGLWMLSGLWLQACAAIQTAAIVTMNALEIRYARELLLSPPAMLMANTVLLSVAWYVALGS